MLEMGIAWDDLPAELGCGFGKTCRRYLRRWHRAGVWLKLHTALLAELNGADKIDWNRALIDASFAKAPEGSEDTGPNPTDRGRSGSKHHLMTDARGIPLSATVTAANVNEVTQAPAVLTGMPPSMASRGRPAGCRSGSRATAVSIPSRCAASCAGSASRPCWPDGARSAAAG